MTRQRSAAALLAAVLLAGGCSAAAPQVGSSTSVPSTPVPPRSSSPAAATTPANPRTAPCAAGSYSVGIHLGYYRAVAQPIRLCAVRGLASSAPESRPGSLYYIAGAAGHALVNAAVSRAVIALARDARAHGRTLSATSTFRSMTHQRRLCRQDHGCRHGDYRLVAPPGWSNHQLGDAIDFAGTNVTGGRTCAARATDPASPAWRFLHRRAAAYGLHQYSAESWHWDAGHGADRC